jgi:hypothetical protein
MSTLTTEQLLLEAAGLLDRISERLGGANIMISNGRPGQTIPERFYLVKFNGVSVANMDPVVALYDAMAQRVAA